MSFSAKALLLAMLIAMTLSASAAETTGVYVPSTGTWLLRKANTSGDPDISVPFGGAQGDLPVAGDWDGDGDTDIGIFRKGTFVRAVLVIPELCFTCTRPRAEPFDSVVFGQAGDLPVVGDWNGDGIDDVGVFRPGPQGTFLLRVPITALVCPLCLPRTIIRTQTVTLGTAGQLPVAGDWNGDGIDDVGLYDPQAAAFLLSEDGAKPTFFFNFGIPGDRPLAGDWQGTGRDGVGVFRAAVPTMLLTADVPGQPEIVFSFGVPSEGLPVAGAW